MTDTIAPPSSSSLRIGADIVPQGVRFRVWAPEARTAHVRVEADDGEYELAMAPEDGGFFSCLAAHARAGERYRFRLDGGAPLPDPASRFQPHGPHGASEIVDARAFRWSDHAWRGIAPAGQVIYEMHVGTFTHEGTWEAAIDALPALAELGVTVLELMPLAEFPGRFGWGYDGVCLYAPYHGYGPPDDMRRFVDAAHALGLGVIVDVVYNHFGPDGNYLPAYSRHWVGTRKSEWGDAPNFDGPHCAPVREFFAGNAAYWIEEFHADGLRLDATQQIFDRSAEHILKHIVRRARAAAPQRNVYIVAENEVQNADLVRAPERGGMGCDAIWNDDFHHTARAAIAGRREAYYSDYRGSAQEFVSALKYGFLYQGQRSAWIDKPRGSPAFDVPALAFVNYLENHDQVANSLRGSRLGELLAPAAWRAATAVLLLAAQTPLIFQGQEYASTRPFLYFADHAPGLAGHVRTGRARFMAQFPSIAAIGDIETLPDPADIESFRSSKLEAGERGSVRGAQALALFRDLLALRREDDVMSGRRRTRLDGAVLGERAFAIRHFGSDGLDRLFVVNFAVDIAFDTIAEPLIAVPAGCRWKLRWSSEELRYGGAGHVPLDPDGAWRLTSCAALLFVAERRSGTEESA
ncbi:MAG TPA: malto-oligosyltrehalose trehalohydrolase [Rudaea sp.]|nr:malto-oligosyltrehalose trehalohydrolase [Rudaea sp.]